VAVRPAILATAWLLVELQFVLQIRYNCAGVLSFNCRTDYALWLHIAWTICHLNFRPSVSHTRRCCTWLNG